MANNEDRAQAKKVVRAHEKIAQAYINTFGTVDGRLVLKDLMSNCHMMSTTYKGNMKEMLLNEGERMLVLKILKYCNINPNKLRERIEKYERDLENDDVV